MRYKLYEYQEDALDKLLKYSDILMNSIEKNKYILLKAITGAGKTVIAGSYIEEMFNEHNNLAFIWISVGKGKLHEQSRNSLKEKLSPSISIKMSDEALRSNCLHHKDVLVLNWEGLNTTKTDEVTGEVYFDNIVMRDGEQRNLRQLWSATKDNGTKIVLIVDESHTTAKSNTSKEIIKLIDPDFTLEITATPDQKRIPTVEDSENEKAFYVGIKTNDVIQSQVIKKAIVINDIIDNDSFENTVDLMIKQAVAKRNELLEAYQLEKENINPLCLIQIPNGKDGDVVKNNIIELLEEKGYSISNGKLAIWLSDKDNKLNLEDITNNNSPVDFLIFKQAVATGWDCPRAYILIKLRDTKSTSFDLQTVGRILRMPNRKHYTYESLNKSYIYTNSDYTVNTGDYDDKVLTSRQVLKKEFRDEVLALKFISEKYVQGNCKIDDSVLESSFIHKISSQPLNFNLSDLKFTLKKSEANLTDFDKAHNTKINMSVEMENHYKYTVDDINKEFIKLVKSISNKHYPFKSISTILLKYFSNRPELSGNNIDSKRAILLNQDIIIQYFNEIKVEYKNTLPTSVKIVDFSFTENRDFAEKETVAYNKCAYYKHFKSKYTTETTFENYLESLDNVKFWIKNIDHGNGLSIIYDYDKVKHEFYPDYIIKFKNDSIGIYEVKELHDKEKDTITKRKMEKLRIYANDNDFKCGLIEIDGSKVHLPTLPKELK